MRKRIIQLAYIILGGALTINVLPVLWRVMGVQNDLWLNNVVVNFLIGGLISFIISVPTWRYVDNGIREIENFLNRQSPLMLLVGSLGTLIGLALAVFITAPLQRMDSVLMSSVIPVLIMLLFGYLGFRLGTTRIDEWRNLIPSLNNMSRLTKIRGHKKDDDEAAEAGEENYHHYKILDTNILIDGRILDIVKTGFIEGTLLVPNFVLYELQYLADKGEEIKRVRGRRGLDVLNELREQTLIPLEMWEGDYKNIKEVDEKLIQLAKDLDGALVTNDFNLNKVTQFQSVKVLNLNALAGALRPSIKVGDRLTVMLVKNGTERQQAVAYLDDGTMVVVEDGRDKLQQKVNVEVTSALQTDAGRMIFAKLV